MPIVTTDASTIILIPQLIPLVTGAVVAGLVQGISGFAFGMVAMSVWAWGIDPVEATTLAVFGGLCGQVFAALTTRRRMTAPELLPFLMGGLIGIPIGTYLLPHLDAMQFELLLGAILVVACPLMLAAPRIHYVDSVGRTGDGVAGFTGGVIGGLSGMTGVAPAIWCVLRGYEKSRQRELLQNFNLTTLAAAMVALMWRGAVTKAMIPRLGIVAIAMLVPAMLGARIYRQLSDAAFRRVVLILLTLSGVALIASAVRG